MDENDRLAAEVTALSTRLMTEVAKSSSLEETVHHLRKENRELASRLGDSKDGAGQSELEKARAELDRNREELAKTKGELEKARSELASANESRAAAEAKNAQLEGEVEDLTASLFNEANQMVSDASRETHQYKIKNRKLQEELGDKDAIIDSLQGQLTELKALIMRMEDDQAAAASVSAPAANPAGVLAQTIYSPRVRALRYDLPQYQVAFKAFVYQLIKPDFVFDLASLKNLRYFRAIWTEELEPALERVPSGTTFMSRFSKGRTLWALLAEGRAIIEPVSGVNETFKLTYKGEKTGKEVPVAVEEPCSFCGEDKSDRMEHARLYYLKLYEPVEGAAHGAAHGAARDIAGEAHEVVATHALCNFCLVKLRAICDFFAKLRLVHGNIYRLSQCSAFDDVAYVQSFQFKRAETQTPGHAPSADEAVVLKLYMTLLALRAKIFWSRRGIWDTEDDVDSVRLDEIPMDVFRQIVRDDVTFGHDGGESATEGNEKEERDEKEKVENKEDDTKGTEREENDKVDESDKIDKVDKVDESNKMDAIDANKIEKVDKVDQAVDQAVSQAASQAASQTVSDPNTKSREITENAPSETEAGDAPNGERAGRRKKNKKKKAAVSSSSEEDFVDSASSLPSRRPSRSKQFKQKMDTDLENTIEMLKESIAE